MNGFAINNSKLRLAQHPLLPILLSTTAYEIQGELQELSSGTHPGGAGRLDEEMDVLRQRQTTLDAQLITEGFIKTPSSSLSATMACSSSTPVGSGALPIFATRAQQQHQLLGIQSFGVRKFLLC